MATADEYAQWIVNNADKRGTPEFNTVAAAYQDAKQAIPAQPQQAIQPEKKSFLDTFLDNLGRGAGQGATPEEVQQSGQHYLDTTAGAVSGAGDIGSTIINPLDKQARDERKINIKEGLKSLGANPDSSLYTTGKIGTQIAGTAGIGGALAKPLLAAAKYAPALGRVGQAIESAGFNVGEPALTLGNKALNAALRVGGGATTGAAAAGLINPDNAGTGAVVGGALGAISPIVNKAVQSVAGKFIKPTGADQAAFNGATDEAINKVATDLNIKPSELPQDTVNLIKSQVMDAFKQGKQIDPAALLRQKEFEKLGIQPLQGQITRDPTQFAQELNLRGVSPEIAGRLQQQNTALQGVFGKPAAEAVPSYQAGNQLSEALNKYQTGQKANISSLYEAARSDTGRFANVDVPTFSKNANDALDSQMLGRFVPEQVKGLLNDISAGNLPLNVNNLVQVDSVLSQAQRNADAAGKKAIGVIRDALNNAPIESGAGEAAKNAFDIARKAARANFAQQDAIPALKAVAEGDAIPDTFVKKFVIQGKTDEVKKLADLLRGQSPESFSQAKAQVADDIRRAAFGENLASDAPVSPERLAKKLRELGSDKMSAFFSPEEIANYQTANRVATYIQKHPNAAPVNTSNTLVAQLMTNPVTNFAAKGLEMMPGGGAAVAAAKAATGAVKNQMAASQAMNTKVPTVNLNLTEGQRRLLGKALGATSGAISAELAN